MMRGATIIWAVLATVAGTGLFLLKYQVQAQEQRLSGLHKQINGDQEAIHVLKAEWSYLNDPGRLREQAEHHLGMHPLKASQIVKLDSLPMADPRPAAPPAEQAPAADVPMADGAPVPEAAPVATAPAPPPVAEAPVIVPNPAKPKQLPHQAPTKPARTFTASAKPAPKPAAKPSMVAQAKPVAPKPVAVAQAKPVATPSYPAYPATYATYAAKPEPTSSGNVMVITSPALAAPERTRP